MTTPRRPRHSPGTSTRLVAGALVGGRYRLEERVGQGGSGSVWRARHAQLDSTVALKLLYLGHGDDRAERALRRFEREAKLAASVRHHNVVHILDYGRESATFAYMVMEYLGGGTLADLYDGGATGLQLLPLVLQALQGLVAVHDAGLVHRDLKPENIALSVERTGIVTKLVDFGISRQLRSDANTRSAVTTVAGRVFGTPEYMSPEQTRGLADIDVRADVYAVGALLYECFARHVPYSDPNLGDLMIKIVRGGAPHLRLLCPELPDSLSDTIMRSLSLDRQQRPQSAAELLGLLSSGLEEALARLAVPTPPIPAELPRTRRSSSLEYHWDVTDEEIVDEDAPTIPAPPLE